jgi:hypothetical protein
MEEDMKVNKYRSLTEAIEKLQERGYRDSFVLADKGLRFTGTGEVFDAADLKIVEHHRFEGQSNPDDMAIMYVVESLSGRRGTIVDAFGTYGDPVLGEFLERIERGPDESSFN